MPQNKQDPKLWKREQEREKYVNGGRAEREKPT